MKATIQTVTPKEVHINIDLEMTMDEAQELLKSVENISKWPMGDFRSMLHKVIEQVYSKKLFNHPTVEL